MKFNLSSSQAPRRPISGPGGFTISEMLMAMAVFSMLVAATVASQVFGLRMYRLSDAKLTVTADARRVLNHVQDEIRSAKLVYVGNATSASFRLISGMTPQVGNGLKICATTDTNTYVYYFQDPEDSTLKRVLSGGKPMEVLAHNVTNLVVFRAEDFQGNTLSNFQDTRAISMVLQFRQAEYNGNMFENYRLQTRIARRDVE